MNSAYTPKYMIACPVNTPRVLQTVNKLRFWFRGQKRTGVLIPTSDYIMFGEAFTTTYQEATRVQLGVELAALRLSIEEPVFTLGEARLGFSECEAFETLYLKVETDEDVLNLISRARSVLTSTSGVLALSQGRTPELSIALFQRHCSIKRPVAMVRNITAYNDLLKEVKTMDPERLIRVGDFVPAVYAKYTTGWKKLGRDPETCL